MPFFDTVSKLGSWLLLHMLGLPETHIPSAMASASAYPNYIDISSSDSDSDVMEIDDYKSDSLMRDTASSNKSRVLPSWASTSQNHSKIPEASSTNNNNRSDGRPLMYSSHEPVKRALPSSVQRSTHKPQLNNIVGNAHEKKPFQTSGWQNSFSGRTRENNFAGGASGSHMHEKKPQWTNFSSGKVKENDLGGSQDHEEKAFSSSAWTNTSKERTRENNPRGDASGNQHRGDAHEKKPSPSSGWQYGRTQENNFRGGASGNQARDVNGKNVMWGPEWLKQGKCPQPPTMSSFASSGDPWVPGRNHPHPSGSSFAGPSNPIHAEYGVEDRGASGAADERLVFQAAVQDLHQPTFEVDLPEGLLSVPLLRHQKIALAWMLSKESSGLCLGGILADDQGLGKTISTISLILMQRFKEAKPKTQKPCTITEVNLDDDDYGSGAVSLYNPNVTKKSEDTIVIPQVSNGSSSKRPKGGTLIVCPASVIRQWNRELQEKVADQSRLSVLIYHGPNRTKDPAVLAKYDAVLTTYAIVTNEVPKQSSVEDDDDDGEQYGVSSSFCPQKKRKKCSDKKKKGKNANDLSAFDIGGALARVTWSRVVLDESQMIKNYKTQVAKACSSLKAKRRWCLSGTPIQNSIDELFSYFRFLRYDPYDNFKHFTMNIKHGISRDSVKGYQKLQVILRNIMLRRTKGTILDGKPIINLPPKTIDLAKGTFSIEERTFYNQLEADSRVQFKAYAAAGTVNQNYANILLLLLRLRQACDHPLLVVKGSEPVGKASIQMAKMLPKELVVNLVKHLETSSAICLACKDPPENGVVTMCGHVFCYQCVSDNLTGEDNTCPAPECKEQLGPDVVYSRTTLRKCIPEVAADGDSPISKELSDSLVLRSEYVSSKVKVVIQLLRSNCLFKGKKSEVYELDEDHASSSRQVCEYSEVRVSEKAIVFSQWTSMLDLLEMSLKGANLNYRRLDGTMSIAARDKAVKDFNTDPKVDVMIMSLKAGNLGLNMIAASRVILLDLWWNPTTEDQAIDRAHRIGQTKPVTVSRLTISDTVEDRILALQEEKRKMVASAFGEEGGGHGSKLTVEDLRFLFGG